MNLNSRMPVIAVIGASDAPEGTMAMAEQVGAEIFQAGWHLVCGGGEGIMAAACKGFSVARERGADSSNSSKGNLIIGMLPTETEDFANPWVDIAIPTGIGWARNAIITRMSRGVVAVGGCSGTLSEIAFAWAMNKPIVALSGSGGWAERLAGESIDERRPDRVLEASSGKEAVNILRGILAG